MNKKQIPGKPYTFIDKISGTKDKGILPKNKGESNSFVVWKHYSWESRKLCYLRTHRWKSGEGPLGLLGRMQHLVTVGTAHARKRMHKGPNATAKGLLKIWKSQNNKCKATGKNLKLLDAVLDHDHKTGKVRGFVHPRINKAEGFLNDISDKQLLSFILWMRPHLRGRIS